jgi:hypothetical protein
MRNTADVTGGKPIAALLQSILGEVLLLLYSPFTTSMEERERWYSYFVPDTTRDWKQTFLINTHGGYVKSRIEIPMNSIYQDMKHVSRPVHSAAANATCHIHCLHSTRNQFSYINQYWIRPWNNTFNWYSIANTSTNHRTIAPDN